MTSIEVQGLCKRFGSTLAVDDLSFTVRPGEVTGFLGPNGAGKSTTMRLILGLDRPSAGSARIGGRAYTELTHPLRTVGALLDAGWVHRNRSARSHLRWLAASNAIPARRVEEMLELVGLASVAGRRVGTFSLGMSQRLGIAGALLGDPPVLLFDEPVNGLDPGGIAWVRALVRRCAADGRAVLVSSHLLAEMALTATELVVIGRGRLVAHGPTTELVQRASGTVVRVRTPQADVLRAALAGAGFAARDAVDDGGQPLLEVPAAPAAQVGEIAAAHSVVLHELVTVHGSLEEAFMELTRGEEQFVAVPP